MRLTFTCFAFLLVSLPAWPQRFTAGIKGGLPLTSVTQDPACPQCLVPVYRNRYTVGGMVEVGLPWGLAVEGDVLVQRLHLQYAAFEFRTPFGVRGLISGYDWQFPLLLKYRLRPSSWVRPYVAAGATLRHLGNLTGKGTRLKFNPPPTPEQIDYDPEKDLGVGITGSAGVSFRTGFLRIAPEVRYTHWREEFYQPRQNQLELLVGITF